MLASTVFITRRLLVLLLLLPLLLATLSAWAQPTISGFSPASGPAGSSVTINGTNFTGVTSVRFGELSAVFTVTSSSQLTAVVPRAASTQLINVTTSAGYTFSATDFTVTRGSSVSYSLVANNFADVSGGTNAAPAVADIDGDGLLDLLVGRGDGTISRYEQTTVNGTAFSSLGLLSTGSANINVGSQATVAIVDLEGDGQLNLLLGRGNGTVSEYEQPAVGAATFAFVRDNVSNISTTSNTATSMTDLDGNGRLELLVGKGDGITSHSEQRTPNTGTIDRIETNFNNLQLSGNAAPFCVDLDGNGRIDILMGVNGGSIYRYEQTATGSFTVSQVSSSFNGITAGSNAKPCVTDIDGDGLLDLLVGRGDGTISRYEQTGTVPAPTISGFTPTYGPVGTTVTVTGSNLGGVSAVTVNNTASTLTGTPTATGFTFTVGSGSTTGVIGVTTPGGTASSSGSFTVGSNTAPTALSLSATSINENAAAGSTVGSFTTTDAQGGPFTYSLVTGTGSTDNGSFGISGSSLTINASPDYETKPSYAIRVRTTDPGGLSFEQAFIITINDVAEVPTVTGFTPTSGTVGTNNVVITGTHFNDAGAVTVRFNGTTATTFTVNSNTQITATVPAGASTGTLSVQNSDGTGTSSGTFTVVTLAAVTTAAPGTVTGSSAVLGGSVTSSTALTERGVVYVAGNGPPTTSNTRALTGTSTGSFSGTVSGLAGNTLYSVRAYAINGAGTSYGATQTFTTGNNPPVAGDNSYTVAEDSGASTFNVLSDDTDPDAGTTLTITSVTQPANGAVTFTSTSVTFTPALNFNGTTTFTYTIADGDGGTDTGTVTMTVTAVNDAPVVTVPGTQTTGEDVPFAFSSGNNNLISIGDVDAGSGQLEIYLGATQGAVSLSTTAGLTFSSGDGTADPSMTFRGTLASINTALNNMTFSPNAGYSGAAALQVQANDLGNTGSGGAKSDSKTVTINVTAVNDAPVVTVPGTQTTNEDVPFAFSSGNGNAITISDADAGSSPVQLSLSVGSGSLSLSGTTGLTFSAGDGTADASMTFQGTLANINAALNNMTYSPAANYNGSTTLTATANDLGNTGSGGAKSDTKTVTINVTAVNDAPVVTVPGTQSTPQDVPFAFSSGNNNLISISDVDAGSSPVEIYLGAGNGAVTLSTTAGLTFVSGSNGSGSFTFRGTLTSVNTALTNMTFSPNAGFYGAASLQVQASDLGNTGSGGVKTDSKTIAINVVQPVNQAPVVTVPGTQSTLFNTPLTFSSANGNALSVADADAGSGQLAIYLNVGYGTATLSTTAGLTFTSGSNGSGGFGFTGTLSAINAALNGLVFRSNNNYSGAASLQVQANDQGNTGSGGAKTDSKTVTINVAANQAPVLTASSGSTTWSQGGAAVAVDAALTASDVDSPNLASATVSITTGFVSGQDVLAFASANGITGSYAAGTGVLTLSGSATVANYQAALRSITYTNTGGTPTAGSRTVRFVANDGLASSAAVTKTVLVVVRPTTTIVSGPGTLTNSPNVSFQFSSDQSPVDYTTTGNPTFTYTGNGANSAFGPLADGTYTLSVAAHNTSTNLTDQTPATYTFTVDTQKPGPTISSAGNTSGGSTSTSPIAFTVTFTEPVTGFALTGISVSSGTKSNFVAVSSTQYTFDLTPAGPATITVDVAAGAAHDAATNPSTAAPQYTITYALPVTAAPAVSYPTSGSTIASTTPTYSGTAPAGSLVTVYVDNASVGTTTATAGGSWSFTQPNALTQATHSVKATAQRTGYAVSAFSAASSFTVDTTAPSVPVVSSPADGSFVGTLRPTYSGTGAGGSTITVYVDNVSVGTTTIAAGGSTWSFTQPTDLTQAAHTVKVTATDGVGNVSAFSAANNFTVDTTAPTVAVSSSVGTSGTTTATTPVPFTVTFNEPVSSFALADITVSSGTKGSFVTVSASQYTFSVTPAGAGAIAVSVAANVAQDRAGNNNVASPGPAFSLTYQPRPTVTALSAAAELPGMPISLTGTNFTSGSTVTVGGTPASVTYNSATSLTATVPAGAGVGSAAVVVTTSGISSTSAPAFAVLKVYDATTSCLAGTGYLTTGDNSWHYLLAGGQVVAALHDTDPDLGTVSVDLRTTGTAGAVRQDGQGRYYLDRNFHLTASGGTFAGSSVQVRFYGLVSELSHLQAADPAATYANLKATQYSGPNEDCDLGNNSAAGDSRVLPLTASTPGGGVAWFVAQATVADHFSEFYLTSSAAPLPVQLVAFAAERRGSTVALTWRTASELNSARFEVERSPDGTGFVKIGQVAAQGTTAAATDYAFADAQPLAAISYYRLRQVDLSGTAHYSPVRTVAAGPAAAPALTAYPVPARAGQLLTVAFAPAGAAVEVLDAVGRRVAWATAAPDGTATLDLPRELPAGVYVVRSGEQARRLVVE